MSVENIADEGVRNGGTSIWAREGHVVNHNGHSPRTPIRWIRGIRAIHGSGAANLSPSSFIFINLEMAGVLLSLRSIARWHDVVAARGGGTMRSTKLELASVGAFALIVAGFWFSLTGEGAWGRRDDKSPRSLESVWSKKGVMK